MPSDQRKKLSEIKQFKQLIAYLRDEMGWPINSESEFDELTYEYTTTELGIDDKSAAQIQAIKRLRPLSAKQPWGVFFVKFEPKKLPVVALRRILGQVALKKRASANPADRTMWAQEDLLFISNYGEGDDRQITLAHFSVPTGGHTLPSLKVLGWDSKDTVLHLEAVARELTEQLSWPADESDAEAWRAKWRAAFTVGHQEVINTSKALSIRLAQLARDIRDRIATALTIETEDGPLTKLMKAFQESLIHDLTPEDFADMYAQTIAYGLLSSRIADPTKKSVDDLSAHMRLSPFLKELMETFIQVGGRNKATGLDFDELGVGEVIDLLDRANMQAVVADFGDKNPREDPVIHFYELFLKEYDEKKRMSRGVFYTPRPVVSYIVRSIHEMLQTDFGLADGLADTASWGEMAQRNQNLKIPAGVSPDQDYIQLLDPATGTGTFLVEVIDVIYQTLVVKWKKSGKSDKEISELWNTYVPKHLLTRLYGYELLMAPYAIAHLKVGIKLHETGYQFASNERARIYLTNTLEQAQDFSGQFSFAIPALAHEASAVNVVKQQKRFTVIAGNPPYSIQSQNLKDSDRAWVESYRTIAGKKINERNALQFEKNIQDDYIKFIRYSQVAIDLTNSGIVGLVTNHSFIDGATFRGMRWSLANSFPAAWILDLHGNATKRERSPDGRKDENVFDIAQGVAISLFAKPLQPVSSARVSLSEIWGERGGEFSGKYCWLASQVLSTTEWNVINPTAPLYLFRKPGGDIQIEYESLPSLADIMPFYSMGVMTGRDGLVVDFDAHSIVSRVKYFVNSEDTDAVMAENLNISFKKGWDAEKSRRELRSLADLDSQVIDYLYHPFDFRKMFYHKAVVSSAAFPVMQHLLDGDNIALVATRQTKDHWDIQCSRTLVGHKSLGAYDTNSVFPLFLKRTASQSLFSSENDVNLSPGFVKLLASYLGVELNYGRLLPESITAEAIFAYVYAVLHSPNYRKRYAAFLTSDFPRVPVTRHLEVFRALTKIGSELISLHVLESPKPEHDLARFIGKPNQQVEAVVWSSDTVWVDKEKTTGFIGVPESVWNFQIGGYQVCEKWLKDRKGRTLSDDDIAHYQKTVVALSETIRRMEEIDEVIEHHGGWLEAFAAIETAI